MIIYENLKEKTTLLYVGEPGVDEWKCSIDGNIVSDGSILEIIKKNVIK